MNTQLQHDDPLAFAIQQQLINADLRTELMAERQRSKALEGKLKQAEKAAKEAQQHKDRADRLRAKLDATEKQAKQIRHETKQALDKARAEARREKQRDAGNHATLTGQTVVRMYFLHVFVLPLIVTVLILTHLFIVWVQGIAEPH